MLGLHGAYKNCETKYCRSHFSLWKKDRLDKKLQKRFAACYYLLLNKGTKSNILHDWFYTSVELA